VYLRHALNRGEGIVVVTGPPGSGKTALALRLLGEPNPAEVISVQLVANGQSPTDLLCKLAYALGLSVEGKDRVTLSLLIERHLVEVQHAQRHVLVTIAEAQTLPHQALEAMRLLTDLQSQTGHMLQLVLFGQEELESVISAPAMEQFQHRVIASCRLQPMDLMETKAYLEYRLSAVNWRGYPSINGPAVMAIYRHSHGVPRHVNKICRRLMLRGSSEERHALDEHDVMVVVRDLRSELLAPLAHDVTAQEATAKALRSVDELALVPEVSTNALDATQVARVNEESPPKGNTAAAPLAPNGRQQSPELGARASTVSERSRSLARAISRLNSRS
jgi:type II secretory pathway predicted ATPase ExeA